MRYHWRNFARYHYSKTELIIFRYFQIHVIKVAVSTTIKKKKRKACLENEPLLQKKKSTSSFPPNKKLKIESKAINKATPKADNKIHKKMEGVKKILPKEKLPTLSGKKESSVALKSNTNK